MRDLRAHSGLPLGLADDGTLRFGGDLPEVAPAVRTLKEMREVLAAPDAAGPEILYYMYRDVGRAHEKAATAAAGLRYDVTVVMPAVLGGELGKTYGHYHPVAPDGGFYPEVYEVISGQAIYLLQRRGGAVVDDVIAVPAHPGDKVYMLPGYGHVTINPGPEPLVMANWVAAAFSSEYGDFRERHGAAYYAMSDGDAGPRWDANGRYGGLPALRHRQPRCPEGETGLAAGRPMYVDGVGHPERLRYLVAPQSFSGQWAALLA